MRVASRIFASLPLIGRSRREVEKHLGPPTQMSSDAKSTHVVLIYIRGNGVVASIMQIELDHGRVTSVTRVPSQ